MSSFFTLDMGAEPGAFCSYCGTRLAASVDEETGAFHFVCECSYAMEEQNLHEQEEKLNDLRHEFEQRTSALTQVTELKARAAAHKFEYERFSEMANTLIEEEKRR